MINIGLLIMEVALIAFLWSMGKGAASLFAEAATKTKAANGLTESGDAFVATASPVLVGAVAGAIGLEAPAPPWPGPAEPYLALAYVSALEKWKTEVAKKCKTKYGREAAVARLEAEAEGDVAAGWLEVVLIGLNVAAFAGYFVFPMTYIFSEEQLAANVPFWPGNDYAEWFGNLLGDVCWTIEPVLVLFVKPSMDAAVSVRAARFLEAAKKEK